MSGDVHAKLKLSLDQLDALYIALDRTRSTSSTVKVDRAALVAILMDHSMLVRLAERAA